MSPTVYVSQTITELAGLAAGCWEITRLFCEEKPKGWPWVFPVQQLPPQPVETTRKRTE